MAKLIINQDLPPSLPPSVPPPHSISVSALLSIYSRANYNIHQRWSMLSGQN